MNFLMRLQNKWRIAPGNHIEIADSARIKSCRVSIKGNNNRLVVAKGAYLRKVEVEIVGDNCTLEIGQDSIIGHGCYLSVKERGISLLIGKNANFSRNVRIMCADGHDILKENERVNPAGSIIIGSNVWLADGAVILKGVTVGDNAVVGIPAVVTRDVPAGSIAAGNPARIVREGITNRWEHTW